MGGPVEVSGDQLRTIVERIEHIEEEIKELNEGKREIFQEAKSNGFDVNVIREIVGCESKTRRSAKSTSPCSRFISERSRELASRRPLDLMRRAASAGLSWHASCKALRPGLGYGLRHRGSSNDLGRLRQAV